MGVGFPSADLARAEAGFLGRLRGTAEARNRALVVRANEHLAPVALDYDRDVLPLTPAGNATERHVCLAYVEQAEARWTRSGEATAYWAERLGHTRSAIAALDSVGLESLVRSVVMKHGGIAYARPDSRSFPRVADVGAFVVEAGGIPAYAWLDGTSAAEREIEHLVRLMMSCGVSAISIVPDRNYETGSGDGRLGELRKLVDLAGQLDLPLVVGTEMNSPGQKFVDDFECEELAPVAPIFLDGARTVYGHSVLQRAAGLGYLSEWAERHFPDRRARNQFFCEVGATLAPEQEDRLRGVDEAVAPDAVLSRVQAS
jgi:hypothetical protein